MTGQNLNEKFRYSAIILGFFLYWKGVGSMQERKKYIKLINPTFERELTDIGAKPSRRSLTHSNVKRI